MEQLTEEEGGGCQLRRFASMPRDQFVPAAWQVTDSADPHLLELANYGDRG